MLGSRYPVCFYAEEWSSVYEFNLVESPRSCTLPARLAFACR